MSDFEDYSRTSRSYDGTRAAHGAEVILGCLARNRPLHETALLDAGCGSGNYAAVLAPQVAKLVGVDLNPGMLGVARDKLAAQIDSGRVELRQGDLTALPLEDASVDAVMVNQVLHHLADRAPCDWDARRRVFAEFARVLRPGGALVINTCVPEQLRHGYWFFALIPAVVERLSARHPDYETTAALLRDAGFEVHGRIVPLDVVLQGAHYFDAHGPEAQSWRDGDSGWSLSEGDELEQGLETLRQLHEDGEAEAFLARHDARRTEVGQITFVHATLA